MKVTGLSNNKVQIEFEEHEVGCYPKGYLGKPEQPSESRIWSKISKTIKNALKALATIFAPTRAWNSNKTEYSFDYHKSHDGQESDVNQIFDKYEKEHRTNSRTTNKNEKERPVATTNIPVQVEHEIEDPLSPRIIYTFSADLDLIQENQYEEIPSVPKL